MSDETPEPPKQEEPVPPIFTKEPQPDLPLELRKQKAGWTKARISGWILVTAVALYYIITGIVGIIVKSR